jgi:hypothetical protein
LCAPLAPRLLARTGIDRRHFDIFQRIEIGQQLVALEDETEMLAPELGQLIGLEPRDVASGEPVFAGPAVIEAAEHVHQCRLAGAGLSDDGDHLAGLDVEVDILEHRDALGADRILAAELPDGNQRLGHGLSLRARTLRPAVRRR